VERGHWLPLRDPRWATVAHWFLPSVCWTGSDRDLLPPPALLWVLVPPKGQETGLVWRALAGRGVTPLTSQCQLEMLREVTARTLVRGAQSFRTAAVVPLRWQTGEGERGGREGGWSQVREPTALLSFSGNP
jgi:hypothetical protein